MVVSGKKKCYKHIKNKLSTNSVCVPRVDRESLMEKHLTEGKEEGSRTIARFLLSEMK